MKLHVLARRRAGAPRRYLAMPLAGLVLGAALVGCGGGKDDTSTCAGGLVDYGGRCVPPETAKYLACIEGRGFSVTDEFSAGVTVPAVANSTFKGAYKRSKDEDSIVALQIVHDCLELARQSASSAGDQQAARQYAQRATRYIDVVRRDLPAIELDPFPTLNCGSVEVGAQATCTVTIRSTGVTALRVSRVDLSGADTGDFRVLGGCVGMSIDPDQSCTMTVEFTPSAAGRRNARLLIHQNIPRPDPGTALQVVGTGSGPGSAAGPTLTVSIDGTAPAGAVVSTPSGLSCPGACTATFADGTDVTLAITYDLAGGQLTWEGCDPPDGDSCHVHVTANRTVVAHLVP